MRSDVMKNISLIIFVLLVLALTARSNSDAVGRDEICVLSSAVVQGAAVYLSDVAVVKAEAEDKARLEKLEVARYESQAIISVGTFEICQALSRAQINPAAWDIFGAGACQVTFAGVSDKGTTGIDKADVGIGQTTGLEAEKRFNTLADELTKTVGQLAGLDAGRLKVDWYGTPKGFLEQAADQNRFKIIPRSTMNLGPVQLEVVDNHPAELNKTGPAGIGGPTGTVSVRGNVQYLCESVVATRPLAAGERIALEDVKTMPQRVTSFRHVGVDDVSLVVGQ